MAGMKKSGPALDYSVKSVSTIQGDPSYRFLIMNQGLKKRGAMATPYDFMVEMRDVMHQSVELIDETLLLLVLSYRQYRLELTMDRDFFEISLVDRANRCREHLDGWSLCFAFKEATWEQFELFLVGTLGGAIKGR